MHEEHQFILNLVAAPRRWGAQGETFADVTWKIEQGTMCLPLRREMASDLIAAWTSDLIAEWNAAIESQSAIQSLFLRFSAIQSLSTHFRRLFFSAIASQSAIQSLFLMVFSDPIAVDSLSAVHACNTFHFHVQLHQGSIVFCMVCKRKNDKSALSNSKGPPARPRM